MPGTVQEALQDPKFLAAPRDMQMKYVAAIDPDFKAGKPEDQIAYLNHITGKLPPTTANNEVEKASGWKPNAGFTPGNMASQAWEGLKQMGSGALGVGKDLFDPRVNVVEGPNSLLHKYITNPADVEQAKAMQDIGSGHKLSGFGHSVAAALPLVGPWAASLGEQAGSGDVGGALSKGGAQALAAEAIPRIPRAMGDLGAKIPGAAENFSSKANAAADKFGASMPETAKLITRLRNPGMLDLLKKESASAPTPTPMGPAEAPAAPETIGPLEKPVGSPMQRMGQLIDEQAGVKPLQPNVPLRAQMGRLPEVGQMPLGNRVGLDLQEQFGERAKTPEKLPEIVPADIGRQMGAPPLRGNVPLREQFKPKPGEPAIPSKQESLEARYPDKNIRQMVHANGPEIVDAIGDDKELMKAVHDLTHPDVRQAMINSGHDMGQGVITSKKLRGPEDMTKPEALALMLKKGINPKQIVELAHQEMSATGKENR